MICATKKRRKPGVYSSNAYGCIYPIRKSPGARRD
jgi:hypothetical protein